MASTSNKSKLKSTSSGSGTNKDWDLDYYRAEHESEEHWQLRRRFMEVHKDKFEEDALVCLAQVFTNVEFMGCKYPAETMRLVGELSQEVAKEFRAKRASKLKRTFVGAGDAAEARAKARRTQEPQKQQERQQNRGRQRFGTGEWEKNSSAPQAPKSNCMKSSALFDGMPFGKFVLHLIGGRNCIRTSAQRLNIEYVEKEVGNPGEKKKLEIFLGGKLVTSAAEENIKLTKQTAFTNALNKLQETCYSIKMNPSRDKIKIDKTGNKVVCGVTREKPDTSEDKRLDATNKGYKMMKMMGWTGGGLGSKTQGREDPVGYLLKNNRAGLGNDACKLDRSYFQQMLKNYINSDDIRELQFESSFTKDERAMLHELAGKFALKSTSHGKGEDRSLVISKKNITDEQILTEVLINKNQTFTDKYLVQVPELKADKFPENKHLLILDL